MTVKAIDLFAGTGWGVACQRLGIEEHAVEIMPEARATRAANGMETWMEDVWDVLETDLPENETYDVDLLIASPPCQTFSMAGSGSGRRALNEVVELIDSGLYRDVKHLREFGEAHDPRTALVLTPLSFVHRHRPSMVVLEQVPPVLPVWERYAEEMRKWGYSVVTGKVHAEQYGVPQTRTRAILVARNDGIEATMPPVTHSKYHTRSPEKLDAGVLKWVSMAEALGWLSDDGGLYFHPMSYGRRGVWPANEPAPTIRSVQRPMPENYEPHPRDAVLRDWRGLNDRPSPTITGGGTETGGAEPIAKFDRYAKSESWGDRVPVEFVSNDKQANSARRPIEAPAPTITGGHDSGNRVWVNGTGENAARRDADKPAPTIHFGKRTNGVTWQHGVTGEPINLDPLKPSTTVAGDPRLISREHHFPGEQNSTSTRVTVQEASLLQSYPADFDWTTGVNSKPLVKGKAFLQIGNAFPPLLAEVILAHMTGESA